jgi:hypothetical protein
VLRLRKENFQLNAQVSSSSLQPSIKKLQIYVLSLNSPGNTKGIAPPKGEKDY